jgi:hypothetical protein
MNGRAVHVTPLQTPKAACLARLLALAIALVEIDGHFNPAGHALTAQLLADWLHRAGLVPATR